MATFGKCLQNLIQRAGLKNLTIAQAVQYDVSYISKWISGKMLPAQKNIIDVTQAIADCVTEACFDDEGKIKRQWQEYGVGDIKDSKELSFKIADELMDAFNSEKVTENEKDASNSRSENYVLLPALKLAEMIKTNPGEDMLLFADIYSLAHEMRLLLIGIENGNFVNAQEHENVKLTAVLDISSSENWAENIYDAIFTIHMLTGMSGIDFELYNSPMVKDKLIFTSDDKYSLSAIHLEGCEEFINVSESASPRDNAGLRELLGGTAKNENLVFIKTTIREMIQKRQYASSMISTNIRWLLGHMMELLLPDDVFDSVLEELGPNGLLKVFPEGFTLKEIKRLHTLSRAVALAEDTRIMIYESALSNLLALGELDFFNHKVMLSLEQRVRCLTYLKELLETDKTGEIAIVEGGFSNDFKYITNPCLFMSDTVCYVRLENNRYKDNILILNEKRVHNLFEKFYSAIWTQRSDVVIDEREKVLQKIEHYIKAADYFA